MLRARAPIETQALFGPPAGWSARGADLGQHPSVCCAGAGCGVALHPRLCDPLEVLAPAVGLVNDSSIILDHAASQVEYHHLICSGHLVLIANGLPAESLFPGIGALEGLTSEGRAEVLGLSPELATGTEPYRIARPVLPAWAGRLFN